MASNQHKALSELLEPLLSAAPRDRARLITEMESEDKRTLLAHFLQSRCPTFVVEEEMITTSEAEGFVEEEWEILEELGISYLSDVGDVPGPIMFDEDLVEEWLKEWLAEYPERFRAILFRPVPEAPRRDLSEPELAALVQDLRHARWQVRGRAVRALVPVGERAIPLLLPLLSEEDWELRKLVVKILDQIESPQAIPGLAQTLISDEDWEIRVAAAHTLRRLSMKGQEELDSLQDLLAALKQALQDDYVHRIVAEILDNLEWTPDNVTEQVHYLIAKGKWQKVVELGHPAVEPLLHMLDGAHIKVRLDVARALGQLGEVQPLIRLLQSSGNLSIQKGAAMALGEIGGEQAVHALQRFLQQIRYPTDSYFQKFIRTELAKAKRMLHDP